MEYKQVFLNELPTKILDATGIIISAEISKTPIISMKMDMNKARITVMPICNDFTLTPDTFANVSSKQRVMICL